MSRPGLVLDVDRSTPSLLFWSGEQLKTERLPIGSRVVYAPEPTAALRDPDAAVRKALEEPIAGKPLSHLLRPDVKVTIAFDDVSLPSPPMMRPDNRQRVIEAVLDMAAEAGVDDVVLVAARGLRRRMTESELRAMLGDRVYEAFAPHGRLWQHDAEDKANLVRLGTTPQGEVLELNSHAADADLLIYVNVSTTTADGGWKSITENLASSNSICQHVDTRTPERLGQVLAEHTKVFQIETTLDTSTLFSVPFLQKREWEWDLRDRATFFAAKASADLVRPHVNRMVLQRAKSTQGMTGVFAGEVDVAHELATQQLDAQQVVQVEGQTDIVTFGIPYVCPYNVNSIMNPVLVALSGLGHYFALHKNKPLVREGGVVVIHHPTRREFDPVAHPSYIDFFEEVLADSTDPEIISAKYEERFAKDPWYTHLYRTSHSFHGVHPFHMWYKCAPALSHLGGVIIVGGDPATVRRLGFKPASTFNDAMEMSSDITGNRSPTLTYLHAPPIFVTEVR